MSEKKVRVYWADREGNPPPLGCAFHWKPFFENSEDDLKSSETIERVDSLPPAILPAQIVSRRFFPDRDTWIRGVKKATDAINRKDLQKVVLARTCLIELSEELNPFAITAALKQKAEGAFLFCFEFGKIAFLGATPERLFARRQNEILSEAVAGTRPRGQSLAEDTKMKNDLLSNSKDRREFSPVQSYLQTTLAPLCNAPIQFSPLSIHETKNVQHLYSQCKGTLTSPINDCLILKKLHPTPALCGIPKEKALELISELEPFNRGYYGGVLGWSTPDASEWIVGIRSCLIEGKKVTLFSGTGIVEGSDGESEWDELNEKLKLYNGIFL